MPNSYHVACPLLIMLFAECKDDDAKLMADSEGHLTSCTQNRAYCTNDAALVATGAPEGWFGATCRATCGLCATGSV